jgi:hypothetical protein
VQLGPRIWHGAGNAASTRPAPRENPNRPVNALISLRAATCDVSHRRRQREPSTLLRARAIVYGMCRWTILLAATEPVQHLLLAHASSYSLGRLPRAGWTHPSRRLRQSWGRLDDFVGGTAQVLPRFASPICTHRSDQAVDVLQSVEEECGQPSDRQREPRLLFRVDRRRGACCAGEGNRVARTHRAPRPAARSRRAGTSSTQTPRSATNSDRGYRGSTCAGA